MSPLTSSLDSCHGVGRSKPPNSPLVAHPSTYRGPQTMHWKPMENMEQKGAVPHLTQNAQRFKRKANKKPKGRVIAAHKSSMKMERVACSKLPPKSEARLYCEPTTGK